MGTWEVIQQFGLPIGMLIVALVTGSMRKWVWGVELETAEARTVALLAAAESRMVALKADYEQRLADQRAAHLRREEEMAAAAARWEQLFFALLGPVSGLAEVVKTQREKQP